MRSSDGRIPVLSYVTSQIATAQFHTCMTGVAVLGSGDYWTLLRVRALCITAFAVFQGYALNSRASLRPPQQNLRVSERLNSLRRASAMTFEGPRFIVGTIACSVMVLRHVYFTDCFVGLLVLADEVNYPLLHADISLDANSS